MSGTQGASGHIRLGIVGYGAQGGLYASRIAEGAAPHVVLGAIADVAPRRRDLAAENHPGVSIFDDYQAMLSSGTVDAVVTTLPHYLHPEVGIASIERGIHVMLEKPAGVYARQVRELLDAAAAKPDVTFAIMLNQRSLQGNQALKRIISSDEIGALRRTTWIMTSWWRPQAYYDQSEWRATWGGEGGGVLVNQAPHQLDLWQWFCGMPRSVFAKVADGFRHSIAVEDEVTALVDFGEGVTGTFITATHDMIGTNRLEILGDRGKIVVEDGVATVRRLRRPEQEYSYGMNHEEAARVFRGQADTSEYVTAEEILINEPQPWGTSHAAVLENFALNILDGTPLLAPGAEGLPGVRLANAIHLSGWLGREVSLDFDEGVFLAQLNERIRAEGRYPERS